MEINIYQKAIEVLVLQGFTIVQIFSNGEYLFFVVYRWQEGYFNTAQSVEFNTLEGINITDFLKRNSALHSNIVEFIASFNKEIENSNLIRLEFQKDCVWFKYSSATGASLKK